MKWYEYTTSLYPCAAVNNGVQRTIKSVITSDFATDIKTLIKIRTGNMPKVEKVECKGTLQCWQPSCYMPTKARGLKPEILNPILCLDFDYLEDYDIEEVKQVIFEEPCVCFVSLSCSGTGIYALILIEEPDRLKDYAEHCFKVFQNCGIPIDTGKGQNPTQLRYVSYDANMLWKEDPIPLKIKPVTKKKIQPVKYSEKSFKNSKGLIKWAVDKVCNSQPGERFETVRKVSYSMGGYGYGLDEILQAIKYGSQFTGVEHKYLKHAEEAFNAGKLKPIAV